MERIRYRRRARWDNGPARRYAGMIATGPARIKAAKTPKIQASPMPPARSGSRIL
jgi:hypothetical protein